MDHQGLLLRTLQHKRGEFWGPVVKYMRRELKFRELDWPEKQRS